MACDEAVAGRIRTIGLYCLILHSQGNAMPFQLPHSGCELSTRFTIRDAENCQSVLNGDHDALMQSFEWSNTPQGHRYWSERQQGIIPLDDADRRYIRRCLAEFHAIVPGEDVITRHHYELIVRNNIRPVLRTYDEYLASGLPKADAERRTHNAWPLTIEDTCRAIRMDPSSPMFFEHLHWHLAAHEYDRDLPAPPATPPKRPTFKAKTYTANNLRSLKYRLLCRLFERELPIPEPQPLVSADCTVEQFRQFHRERLKWFRKPVKNVRLELPGMFSWILDSLDVVLPTKLGDRPYLTYTSRFDYFTDSDGNEFDVPGLPDDAAECTWRLMDNLATCRIVSTNFEEGHRGAKHPHQPGGDNFHACGSVGVIDKAIKSGDVVSYLSILDAMAERCNSEDNYDEWFRPETECDCGCTVEPDDVCHDDDGTTYCTDCFSTREVECPCCGETVTANSIQNDRLRSTYVVSY